MINKDAVTTALKRYNVILVDPKKGLDRVFGISGPVVIVDVPPGSFPVTLNGETFEHYTSAIENEPLRLNVQEPKPISHVIVPYRRYYCDHGFIAIPPEQYVVHQLAAHDRMVKEFGEGTWIRFGFVYENGFELAVIYLPEVNVETD